MSGQCLGAYANPARLRDTVVMVAAVLVIVMLGATLLTVVVCTGLGARRRGYNVPLAVFAGLTFPGAWVVWYIQDDEAGRTF
jgi:hypothetical protein